MRERLRSQPAQEAKNTIHVTLHPLHGEPFVRDVPDLETWQRVKSTLRWDYIAIEVEERTPAGELQLNAEHTMYSGLWRGKRKTDPTQEKQAK